MFRFVDHTRAQFDLCGLVPTGLRGNEIKDVTSFRRPLRGLGIWSDQFPGLSPWALFRRPRWGLLRSTLFRCTLGFIPSPPLGATSLHVIPLHPGLYFVVPCRGLKLGFVPRCSAVPWALLRRPLSEGIQTWIRYVSIAHCQHPQMETWVCHPSQMVIFGPCFRCGGKP